MAKKGLPKGTKFLKINNFRVSEKRWNKFIELADKSNAMYDELSDYDMFGKVSKKKDFPSKGMFDKVFRTLTKRTKLSSQQYKLYRETIFQKNYVEGLYQAYGGRKNLDEVIAEINKLSPDEFYKVYQRRLLPAIYSFYNEYDDKEYWNIIKEQIRTYKEFV